MICYPHNPKYGTHVFADGVRADDVQFRNGNLSDKISSSSEPRSQPTKRSRHDFKPTPEYHTYANNGAITLTESEYSDVTHTHQASHNQIVPESDSAVDHSQSTKFLDASPLDIVEEFIDAIAQ